jgi:hypothetical protein
VQGQNPPAQCQSDQIYALGIDFQCSVELVHAPGSFNGEMLLQVDRRAQRCG